MTKIQIEKMALRNFKGVPSAEYDFGQLTDITGGNGSGKSTIYEAYLWCLFDKNASGNKPKVQPLDADNQVIHNLTTSVELALLVDGNPMKVERRLKETWSKDVCTGTKSEYLINDVPMTLTQFNAKLSELLDLNKWFMISNISIIPNMEQKTCRAALQSIAPAFDEKALAAKSDWYRTPESQWEAGTTGSGAMKALTNGYKIRDLFTDGEYKRNMPLSFKSLIESLDAMDCVGWGFSRESGNIYMRVERWDWFYKNETVITLTDVAEVTRDVYADRIPTSLTIGYKKFATEDQYNSIESPHGKRTFTNGIKALSKALTKESDFIADNYAIEETRRARTQKNATEESSYDENIFVFEIKRYKPYTPIGQEQQPAEFSIPHTAYNAVNVGRAEEFINAKLTPRHMAARWRDYIFATNNSTPFRFTSGEINYKASFGTKPEDFPGDVNSYYLGSMAITSPQVENDDITYTHAKFKAEKITFSCPISREQYSAVKANPYGLVSVNGQLGWIIDFKYSLSDGMTDFTLIAKN